MIVWQTSINASISNLHEALLRRRPVAGPEALVVWEVGHLVTPDLLHVKPLGVPDVGLKPDLQKQDTVKKLSPLRCYELMILKRPYLHFSKTTWKKHGYENEVGLKNNIRSRHFFPESALN